MASDSELTSGRMLRDRGERIDYRLANSKGLEGMRKKLAKEIHNGEDSGEESLDEEEIELMEKQLEELKVEEKKKQKKERCRRLSTELEALTKKKKGTSLLSKKPKIQTKDLRKMSDVVAEVDKIMDNRLKAYSNDASSDSSSESGDEYKEQHRSKRSSKGKASGKSKKVTSYVRFPQL